MILYDYLFYCSYKMGMRSGNFEGLPVLAGMMMVLPNAGIHMAILWVVSKDMGFTGLGRVLNDKFWGYVIYLSTFALMYWYYAYKGRYKRIVEDYDTRRITYWQKHPFVTIVVYFITNVVAMIVVGLLRKKGVFLLT